MTKTHLYYLLGAIALGYFASTQLAPYQPFTMVFNTGVQLAGGGTPAS